MRLPIPGEAFRYSPVAVRSTLGTLELAPTTHTEPALLASPDRLHTRCCRRPRTSSLRARHRARSGPMCAANLQPDQSSLRTHACADTPQHARTTRPCAAAALLPRRQVEHAAVRRVFVRHHTIFELEAALTRLEKRAANPSTSCRSRAVVPFRRSSTIFRPRESSPAHAVSPAAAHARDRAHCSARSVGSPLSAARAISTLSVADALLPRAWGKCRSIVLHAIEHHLRTVHAGLEGHAIRYVRQCI